MGNPCRKLTYREGMARNRQVVARRKTFGRQRSMSIRRGRSSISCQATQLLNYTAPLKWWDARQYLETFSSGNASLWEILRGFGYLTYYYGTLAFHDKLGRPSRWLYDQFQALWGGIPFPRRMGKIPAGRLTPRHDLGLQTGDLVRVRSYRSDPGHLGYGRIESRALL